MAEAGRKENRHAEERGSYHQGVPPITVMTDGGWCKRSYKHTYNANLDVGIIIRKETGQILNMGVTATHVQRNTYPDRHVCFHN